MSDPKQAEEVRILDGEPLKCCVCQHARFRSRDAMLNTKGATFFQVEWLNRTANCYVCERCGFVHWFLRDEARPRKA
jgi:hypothetical protein